MTTKGERRKNKTKKKRRLRALRRVAKEYGLEGLYFYNTFNWTGSAGGITSCSSFCDNSKTSCLVRTPVALRILLDSLLYPPRGARIVYRDDDMKFSDLNELKTHILIKRLAGIK